MCILVVWLTGWPMSGGAAGSGCQISVDVMDAEGGAVQAVVRGRCHTVRVAIQNTSTNLILIRGIDFEGQLGDTRRWYGSQYGEVTRDEAEDLWDFDGMAQTLSSPIFAFGALPPGESLRVTRDVVFHEGTVVLKFSYQMLTPRQVREAVYFPAGGNPTGAVFRRIASGDGALGAMGGGTWATGVVFPEPSKFPVMSLRREFSFALDEGEFPLEAAKRRVEFAVKGSTRWEGGWVLHGEKEDEVCLVSPERAVSLPRCDIRAFALLDAMERVGRVDIVLPLAGYHFFRACPPRLEGPGYFEPGTTVVATEVLPDVLEVARRKRDPFHVVTLDPNGLGARHYLAVGDFDLAVRRAFANGQFSYRLWRDASPVAPQPYFYFWETGRPEPERFAEFDEVRGRLANLKLMPAMLVLTVGPDHDLGWVEDVGLRALCEQRGIEVTIGKAGRGL